MIYNIAIDADSLAYKACYRHMNAQKTETDLELAYMEFCGEIAKINDNIFSQKCTCGKEFKGILEYQKDDLVVPLIVFSPRKSFRNEISPAGINFREITTGKNKGKMKDLGYKANRDPDAWNVPGIRDLKKLVFQRLRTIMFTANLEGDPKGKPEADDVVNWLARKHNFFVAAIDKDVINANPTYSFDYNNRKWNVPKNEHQIEQWYLVQTLMGDATDNVQGAADIGDKKARDIVYGQHDGCCTYFDIIEYFDDELDCLINHTLVRMDGFDGDKILPWSP